VLRPGTRFQRNVVLPRSSFRSKASPPQLPSTPVMPAKAGTALPHPSCPRRQASHSHPRHACAGRHRTSTLVMPAKAGIALPHPSCQRRRASHSHTRHACEGRHRTSTPVMPAKAGIALPHPSCQRRQASHSHTRHACEGRHRTSTPVMPAKAGIALPHPSCLRRQASHSHTRHACEGRHRTSTPVMPAKAGTALPHPSCLRRQASHLHSSVLRRSLQAEQELSSACGSRVTFLLCGQEKSNQKRRPPRLALAGHPARQVREPGPGFSPAHPCAGEKASASCRCPLRGLSTPTHRRARDPG